MSDIDDLKTHSGVNRIIRLIKNILLSEFFIWIVLGILLSKRLIRDFIYDYDKHPSYLEFLFQLLNDYPIDALLVVITLLFPLSFYQVFGKAPLQSIRDKVNPKKNWSFPTPNAFHTALKKRLDFQKSKQALRSYKEHQKIPTTSEFLFQLTKNTDELSNKIYTRSGVYLLFGVIIAFSGVLYFSFQKVSIPPKSDISEIVGLLAPRFGILFFIEFIAFFFLKQYRAAMDEFRYYDTIKRNRESQLAIFLMATNELPEKDFTTVVDKLNFFELTGMLSAGETTEFLEASKLNKNEFEEMVKGVIAAASKQEKEQEEIKKEPKEAT
jgi:hypothetical protein